MKRKSTKAPFLILLDFLLFFYDMQKIIKRGNEASGESHDESNVDEDLCKVEAKYFKCRYLRVMIIGFAVYIRGIVYGISKRLVSEDVDPDCMPDPTCECMKWGNDQCRDGKRKILLRGKLKIVCAIDADGRGDERYQSLIIKRRDMMACNGEFAQ